MNDEKVKCPECNIREVDPREIQVDGFTHRPACYVCRLKSEMLAAGCACFCVDATTGEYKGCVSLWEASKSTVKRFG